MLFGRPNQRAGIFKQQRSCSQSEDAGRADVVHKDFHVQKQTQRRVNTIIRFVKNTWGEFQTVALTWYDENCIVAKSTRSDFP